MSSKLNKACGYFILLAIAGVVTIVFSSSIFHFVMGNLTFAPFITIPIVAMWRNVGLQATGGASTTNITQVNGVTVSGSSVNDGSTFGPFNSGGSLKVAVQSAITATASSGEPLYYNNTPWPLLEGPVFIPVGSVAAGTIAKITWFGSGSEASIIKGSLSGGAFAGQAMLSFFVNSLYKGVTTANATNTLNAQITSGATTINVNNNWTGGTFPQAPFLAYIPIVNEFVVVSSVGTGTNWTVQRAALPGYPAAAVPAGAIIQATNGQDPDSNVNGAYIFGMTWADNTAAADRAVDLTQPGSLVGVASFFLLEKVVINCPSVVTSGLVVDNNFGPRLKDCQINGVPSNGSAFPISGWSLSAVLGGGNITLEGTKFGAQQGKLATAVFACLRVEHEHSYPSGTWTILQGTTNKVVWVIMTGGWWTDPGNTGANPSCPLILNASSNPVAIVTQGVAFENSLGTNPAVGTGTAGIVSCIITEYGMNRYNADYPITASNPNGGIRNNGLMTNQAVTWFYDGGRNRLGNTDGGALHTWDNTPRTSGSSSAAQHAYGDAVALGDPADSPTPNRYLGTQFVTWSPNSANSPQQQPANSFFSSNNQMTDNKGMYPVAKPIFGDLILKENWGQTSAGFIPGQPNGVRKTFTWPHNLNLGSGQVPLKLQVTPMTPDTAGLPGSGVASYTADLLNITATFPMAPANGVTLKFGWYAEQ